MFQKRKCFSRISCGKSLFKRVILDTCGVIDYYRICRRGCRCLFSRFCGTVPKLKSAETAAAAAAVEIRIVAVELDAIVHDRRCRTGSISTFKLHRICAAAEQAHAHSDKKKDG